MESIREKAQELLESGIVQVVVGYEKGTFDRRRPAVIRRAEQTSRLVFDEACRQNLASYLMRNDVRRLGRRALIARPEALRTLLQLLGEHQIQEGDVLALAVRDGRVVELSDAQAIEAHLATEIQEREPRDRELLQRLAAMTRAERWAFWQSEFQRCVKCYACRSSCPMCYCGRCTMDCNRPQWVPVPSHALGNLEYHTVRTMHLAGRCVECGACGRACPVGILVHLLTFHIEESMHQQFGQSAGRSAKVDYALSTFRPDDQASFIR